MITRNHLAGSNDHYIRLPFYEFAAAQKELGITNIELAGIAPHLWCDHLSPVQTAKVTEILEEAGIHIIAFSPKAYRYSLCAKPDSIQVEATLNYYKNCINATAELGCSTMVVSPEGGCFDTDQESLWENCRQTLAQICREAEKQGIDVLIHSVPCEDSPILTSLDEVERMISEVSSGRLGAVLDLQIASMCGETISQWFDQLGKKIKLVRFTDGNYNGYRVWGEGCLPCQRFLEELKKTGYNGFLSLPLIGDRYIESPLAADRKNLTALEGYLR